VHTVLEDNGSGFIFQSIGSNAKKIGLHSVLARLKHYYGDAYKMEIQSEPGNGTRITITFPFSN
jgi:two-component system sensor histidine kinase YesM